MERSVLEEVRRYYHVVPQDKQLGDQGQATPLLWDPLTISVLFLIMRWEEVPPRPESFSIPVVSEAHRVADQFCEQYRVLREGVEILQEENTRLRRMLQRFLTPITVVPPSPPRE